MVFYFESNIVQPPAVLFMGVDKYESNIFLLKSTTLYKTHTILLFR